VYAHFATREQLLAAVVERAVRHATTALDAADPAAACSRSPSMTC
jgi:AcrR family transcriptional regulator